MIVCGDALTELRKMPDGSVHCVVTSPPYWGLRDYGVDGQLGLESTPEEYVSRMVEVFREVRRVLRDDGTCWVNLGDSYASDSKGTGGPSEKQLSNSGSRYEARRLEHGLKPKDLVGIPWMVAFALRADGWWLRQDIIWAKPNPMPESVTDRCTKAHEYLFLLAKSGRYYFNAEAIAEPLESSPQTRNRSAEGYAVALGDGRDRFSPGERIYGADGTRNKRIVWTIATQAFAEAHFATFPEELVRPCVMAGCPDGGTVLDIFAGSGTVGVVAIRTGRRFVGIELNPKYVKMAERRIQNSVGLLVQD